MTENSSKDYTKMLDEVCKPYGCYGITSTEAFGIWCDNWLANGGDSKALMGHYLLIDTVTTRFTMWSQEVFKDDER